jgi:copper homeostasis protein
MENQELRILLEACVDSMEAAIAAEQRGAHRLELCANLHLDGTTPDPGLIAAVLKAVKIPVKVMIRPRGGDFIYTDAEFMEMLASISKCKAFGVEEIATGILQRDHSLDIDRIRILAEAASPMYLTIHKKYSELGTGSYRDGWCKHVEKNVAGM